VSEEPARRYETVELYRTGSAAKIVLNRPERMNAWSDDLSRDLLEVLRDLAGDDDVRAVILTRWYHPIVTTIREMPKPVISAVNGPAAGAGLSLALAADLVVAKESAYFVLAFVNIGLVPDGGGSLFVPARIGFARAAEMAMLGERVPAPKAVDIGLINASWPDEEFEKNAEALLLRLSNGPTRSYAGTKRELNHWLYSRMAEHLALEASIQGEVSHSSDFDEGITAFLEKRPAHFTGR
jgi:2-(1,2-epoxy-1,2-dihydrophenyl)acetyl-CoA isomerase